MHRSEQPERKTSSRSDGWDRATRAIRPEEPVRIALQARERGLAGGPGPSAEALVQRAQASPGHPLPASLQPRFEASLGKDLSAVRVHLSRDSAAASKALGARAYALGQDVHFAAGEYNPESLAGQRLLAHEVAHTAQHAGGVGGGPSCKLSVSQPYDPEEVAADRAADAMVVGAPARLDGTLTRLARTPDDTGAGAPAADGDTAAADKPRYPKWKNQTAEIPILKKLGGSLKLTYGDEPSVAIDLKKEAKADLFKKSYSQSVQIAPGLTGSITGEIKGSLGASVALSPSAQWVETEGSEEQSCVVGLAGKGEVAFSASGSLQLAAGVGAANMLALEGGIKGALNAKAAGWASLGGVITKKPDASESGSVTFLAGVSADLSAEASLVADVVVPGDRVNVYEKTLGKIEIGKAGIQVGAVYTNGAVTEVTPVITAEWFPVPPLEERAKRQLTEKERREYYPSELDMGASGAGAEGPPPLGPEEVPLTDDELFEEGGESALARLLQIQNKVVPFSGLGPATAKTVPGTVLVDGAPVRGVVTGAETKWTDSKVFGREVSKVTKVRVDSWSSLGTPTVDIVAKCAKTPSAVGRAILNDYTVLQLTGVEFEFRTVPATMGSCSADGSDSPSDPFTYQPDTSPKAYPR